MKKIISLFIVIFIFYSYSIFPFGIKQLTPVSAQTLFPEEPVIPQPTRAERVMKALFEAFHEQLDKVESRNNDWAILMNGIWYYYAGGRLLPESQLKDAEKYRPYQFYQYSAELPPLINPTPQEIERFISWSNQRRETSLQRSGFFIDELWHAATRTETENQIVSITFLGKSTKVHKTIQPKLAIIEQRIQAAARIDNTIRTWINNLAPIEGYGWRNIANSQSRSYHSYGLAIDLLPKSLNGKQSYWLWTAQHRTDWWAVSYNERYHPPETVIKIFESYGFVWGGKWLMFDTMHFEYRPEVFYLNGLPLAEK
jgi:hypothetical protein